MNVLFFITYIHIFSSHGQVMKMVTFCTNMTDYIVHQTCSNTNFTVWIRNVVCCGMAWKNLYSGYRHQYVLGKSCVGSMLTWWHEWNVTSQHTLIPWMTYHRHDPMSKGFMSSKTFTNLLFSWASHQKVDFRKSCEWCGSWPSVLACGATKIGIVFKSCNIAAIVKPASCDVVLTPHRRFKRCFLSSPDYF